MNATAELAVALTRVVNQKDLGIKMNIRLRLISAVAIAGVFAPLVVSAQQYTVTDLGTLGGSFSAANGINSTGQVVGNSFLAGNTAYHAFFTGPNGQQMVDLGTLGGTHSDARMINDSGRIVGVSVNQAGISRAYFFDQGFSAIVDLGALGGQVSAALAVNSLGQIVGYAETANGKYDAFVTKAGGVALIDLGNLGGNFGVGMAINDSGQVAGQSETSAAAYESRIFISDPSTGALTSFAGLGGPSSSALSLNAAGIVAGWSLTTGSAAFRAIVLDTKSGVMTDLGTLGGTDSYSLGINSGGLVVGSSKTATSADHGFLYANGKMLDLNSMVVPSQQGGYTIQVGNAINDKGQIAATGIVTASGEQHALLLSPANVAPTVQPTLTGTVGTNGWYRSPVTLSWTVAGLPAPTTVGCGATTVTADTKGRLFTCTATNSVGTASQSVTVKVDKAAPQAAITAPQSGNEKTYNRNQAVFAKYTCSDLLSGVASCAGSVANGARVSTSTPGAYSFVVTATDRAGNTATKTVNYRVR